MMSRLVLPFLVLLAGTSLVLSKSVPVLQNQDILIPPQQLTQAAASPRQLGGGLSALGTLVSPLLFLMGMGSFISMLPQMFQTVLSGVGSNLIQSFTGAASGAAAGGSSTRLKREVPFEDNLLEEIEKRFKLALLNYEGHRGI